MRKSAKRKIENNFSESPENQEKLVKRFTLSLRLSKIGKNAANHVFYAPCILYAHIVQCSRKQNMQHYDLIIDLDLWI